jgi:hypothetical protein
LLQEERWSWDVELGNVSGHSNKQKLHKREEGTLRQPSMVL